MFFWTYETLIRLYILLYITSLYFIQYLIIKKFFIVVVVVKNFGDLQHSKHQRLFLQICSPSVINTFNFRLQKPFFLFISNKVRRLI